MGLSLVNFVSVLPVVGQVGTCQIGRSVPVFDSVYIGHWDKVKIELSFKRVKIKSIEKILHHAFDDMGTMNVRPCHPGDDEDAFDVAFLWKKKFVDRSEID